MAIDIDTVERRGENGGRRESDLHKCVFHSDFEKRVDSNKTHILNCLIAIKDRIKILEEKMSGTVSVKIAAIITTVAMGFLIVFIGACFALIPPLWQGLKDDLRDMNYIIIGVEHRIDAIQTEQAKTSTKQDNIIEVMGSLKNQIADTNDNETP